MIPFVEKNQVLYEWQKSSRSQFSETWWNRQEPFHPHRDGHCKYDIFGTFTSKDNADSCAKTVCKYKEYFMTAKNTNSTVFILKSLSYPKVKRKYLSDYLGKLRCFLQLIKSTWWNNFCDEKFKFIILLWEKLNFS